MAASKKRPPSRKPPPPSGPSFKPSNFIASHPVFRFDEFLEAHQASGATRQTTAALLRYHVKSGRLVNLRRGLYVHPGSLDPWVLGSRLSSDAVIAYDGALSFYGLGPLEYSISFLTHERAGRFVHDQIAYQPVRDPKALRKSDRGGHINVVERSGQAFKVTSRERTLVDVLDRLDLGHGTRELWDSFNAAAPYFPDVMVDYARSLKSQIVAGRLGFFFERLGAQPEVLRALEKLAPKSPAYFERGVRAGGEKYLARWKLVVSKKLLDHIDRGVPLEGWDRDVRDY